MKPSKKPLQKANQKLIKFFKPLSKKQLEKVVVGSVGSRGAETNVQDSN